MTTLTFEEKLQHYAEMKRLSRFQLGRNFTNCSIARSWKYLTKQGIVPILIDTSYLIGWSLISWLQMYQPVNFAV